MAISFTAESLEIAPGIEWSVLSGEQGNLALPAGSQLLDRAPILVGLLDGDVGGGEVFPDACFEGREGNIYPVETVEDDDSLVAKTSLIKEGDPSIGFAEPTLCIARYGGVCIEAALGQDTVIDGAQIVTPHYEGIVTAPGFEGVIMTREEKYPLSGLLAGNKESVLLCAQLSLPIQKELHDRLIRQGVTIRFSDLDLSSSNLLVATQDGAVDWSEICIIDAVPQIVALGRGKMWESSRLGIL